METRKDSVGIIYIHTEYDSIDEFRDRCVELDATIRQDYVMILIDGTKTADLSACLNEGVRRCMELGTEYIHWCHGDFSYTQPEWYDTLRNFLQAYPQVLKVCASNSRDEIHPTRIGQEQSWLMRTEDFVKYNWLWFDERYIRCGGCEDYAQHLTILGYGFLICIIPDAQVYHKGAQTRGKYDTNPHQLYNQGLFSNLTGFGGLVEVHQARYFGLLLEEGGRLAKLATLPTALRSTLGLDKFEAENVANPAALRAAILPKH